MVPTALSEALAHVREASVRRVKLRSVRPLERALAKEMRGLFGRQGRAFLARLARRRKSFDEALSPKDWRADWNVVALGTSKGIRQILDRTIRRALKSGTMQALGQVGVGVSFDLKNPRAVRFLRNRAAKRVTAINDQTRDYLKTVLTNAADKGWSYQRTAAKITERFAEFSRSRAELIATTEIGNAYEAGNRMVVDELASGGGLPMEKAWITVGDDRVDEEICGPNEDAGWIPLEDDFPSGDQEPEGHPGCRCTCDYRVVGT